MMIMFAGWRFRSYKSRIIWRGGFADCHAILAFMPLNSYRVYSVLASVSFISSYVPFYSFAPTQAYTRITLDKSLSKQ